MAKYLIRKTYIVEAGDEIAARQVFLQAVKEAREEAYLERVDVQRVVPVQSRPVEKPKEWRAWVKGLTDQLFPERRSR